RTESGKIIDIIQRMALAHPGVSFRLTLDHSEKLYTKGNGNLKEVISDIYGLNVARHAVRIDAQDADFKITGYAIRPEVNRSSKNYINLSVNQRHIRNFRLSQSIINAYHTLLAKEKYPIVVIDMEMDPKIVDVNVHPAKIEVRFSKEKELNGLLESAVRMSLKDEMLIPDVSKQVKGPKQRAEQSAIDFTVREESVPAERTRHDKTGTGAGPEAYRSEQQETYRTSNGQTDVPPAKKAGPYPAEEPFPLEETVVETPREERVKEKLPYLESVGQLHGTYINLQNESGMYMMDQHAAQERIKYEFYYDRINADADAGVPLLIPYTFEFPLD